MTTGDPICKIHGMGLCACILNPGTITTSGMGTVTICENFGRGTCGCDQCKMQTKGGVFRCEDGTEIDVMTKTPIVVEPSKDRGGWIQTYSGKAFFPFDPRVEDIDINDILHALSNQCRFAGHCTQFYSVAQHCVLVSQMCDPKDALYGLLHDATEAYLVDIPSPLKKSPAFAPYRETEKRLMETICQAFGLESDEPPSVKLADRRMLATEARDLTMTEGRGWATEAAPFDFHIQPWTPEYARAKFISRLHELTMKVKR